MNQTQIVISGTGVQTPPHCITNDELVATFNAYVARYNQEHADEISQGQLEPLRESSAEFIEKASGIKRRYVIEKSGILNIDLMRPDLKPRADEDMSIQCELALPACQRAMEMAGKKASDIDAVIMSSTVAQRAFPTVSIEIQNALGIKGFAFDMNMACSAATFGIETAAGFIANNRARSVLVIGPEVTSAFTNFRDRDSHFIFGDVAAAVIVERKDTCTYEHAFDIVHSQLFTSFTNTIRNNFGYMTRLENKTLLDCDQYFYQQGRKVFKEVSILASNMIVEHLASNGISPDQLKRLWLHQANGNMNQLIAQKILSRKPTEIESPMILDEYGNTASCGSIIAFNEHHRDLNSGDLGILCSFGAGYSIGNVILQKL